MYMAMSRDQNAGRSYNIKTDNTYFESVSLFKYFGTSLTNQNSMQEKMKSRRKSGNAYYHSVLNLLCSNLLSKNIKVYVTINLPVVLYERETWSLTIEGKM